MKFPRRIVMKSELIECQSGEEYPKLMISKTSDLVVLFAERECGMVVAPDDFHPISESSDDWDMGTFEDFNGVIKLSN